MKKLAFLFIVLALLAESALAQNVTTKPGNRWGFGAFAGVNLSIPHVARPYPEHFGIQAGWLIGADANYWLTDRSSLRVQPSLVQVSNVKAIHGSYDGSPVFSLTTLKIPVVYRHYVLPTPKFLFVEVGAAYNQIVASNYREDRGILCGVTGTCFTQPPGPELYPLTKSAVSLTGGIGIDITMQKVTIPVTLRYERYVSNYAFPGNNYDQIPRTSVSFQNVSLTTGVNF